MLKKLGLFMAAIAVAAGALAQTTNYTIKTIREPPLLQAALNADGVAIDGRLDAIEATESGGALAEGKILVGDAQGAAAAVTPSGDATVSAAGVFTLTPITLTVAGNAGIATNLKVRGAAWITGALVVTGAVTSVAGFTAGTSAGGSMVVTNLISVDGNARTSLVTYAGGLFVSAVTQAP